MTVTTTSTRVAYIGDGVTITPYAVPFSFVASADLVVTIDGVTQTLTTNYTVSGGNGSTGTVSFVAAPAVGVKIVIRRQTARTRTSNYVANDPVPATTLNNDPDKLTRIVQEIDAKAGRALRFPDYEDATITLPGEVERAGGVLVFNDVTGAPEVGAIVGDPALVPTQPEAAAGVINSKSMTPLRTKQAIQDGRFYSAGGAGASDRTLIERLRNLNPTPWDYGYDGSGDVVPALNLALASHDTIYFPPGQYLIGGAVNPLLGGKTIFADAGTSSLVQAAGSYDMFTVQGDYNTVRGFEIEGDLKSGGVDFRWDTGVSATVIETIIEDIISYEGRQMFGDKGTGKHYRNYMRRCKALQVRAPMVALTRAFAFTYFERCVVDFIGSTSPNQLAVSLVATGLGAAAGGYFLDFEMLGTAGSGATSSQRGLYAKDAFEVHLHPEFSIDTFGGIGLELDGCNNGELRGDIGLCDGHAMVLRNCGYFNSPSMKLRGRREVAGTDGKHGILFDGAHNEISFCNTSIFDFTGDGVNDPATSTLFLMTAPYIRRCDLGIRTTGSGDRSFSGGRLYNYLGDYNISSAGTVIDNIRLTGGGQSGYVTGPASG